MICGTCGRVFAAQRSTRRTCSDACRQRRYRNRKRAGVTATTSLRGYTVEPIGRRAAAAIILPQEPLATMGRAAVCFGLRDPQGRLVGACVFGHGPHAARRSHGEVVLERGACLPDAPPNSASYMIGRAVRWGRRWLGWRTVRAYSDGRFGEAGAVYRAAGFTPCPPSRHGKLFRYALVENGRVLSDRAIFRRHGSHAAAHAADAVIVKLPARQGWLLPPMAA